MSNGGWKLFAAIAALFGGVGVVVAVDQHAKRKSEHKQFSEKLSELEARLAAKETELRDLTARLGEKNEQVRTLAEEVEDIRAKIAQARSAA
jgi:uncharacterized protein involved in exopolysaccharide biosynthesis